MIGAHTEEAFEALIEDHLLTHGGYEKGDPEGYDRERAVLPQVLFDFIAATQPKAWKKLAGIHKDKLQVRLLDEVAKVMDKRGSLHVLRHGFKFYGQLLRLAYFAPAHNLNPGPTSGVSRFLRHYCPCAASSPRLGCPVPTPPPPSTLAPGPSEARSRIIAIASALAFEAAALAARASEPEPELVELAEDAVDVLAELQHLAFTAPGDLLRA